jgi:hypothetical protein
MTSSNIDIDILDELPPTLGANRPGAAAYSAPAEIVHYYTFQGLTRDQIYVMLANMIHYEDDSYNDTGEFAAWFWTLIEAVFPGLPANVFSLTTTHRGVPHQIHPAQTRWMMDGWYSGSVNDLRQAQGRPPRPNVVQHVRVIQADGSLRPAEQADFDHDAAHPDAPNLYDTIDVDDDNQGDPAPFEHLPGMKVAERNNATKEELVAAVATVIYALGKRADAVNLVGFHANRMKSVMQKLRLGDAVDAWWKTATNLPALVEYQTVSSYFSSRHQLRSVFVKIVLSWTVNLDVSPDQDIVATLVKLWRESGLNHVRLIKSLIRKYFPALTALAPLMDEVRDFLKQYKLYTTSQDDEITYNRVILGDRSSLLPARNYPELLKLAKKVATKTDPGFARYAAGVGDSLLWNDFLVACGKKNLIVPGEDAAGSADRIEA